MCFTHSWGAWPQACAGVAVADASEKVAVSWSDAQEHDQGWPRCARAQLTSSRPSATTSRPSTVAGSLQDRSASQVSLLSVCDVGWQVAASVGWMSAVGSQLVMVAAQFASSGAEAT